MRTTRSGFSLIELLVVITVAGVVFVLTVSWIRTIQAIMLLSGL